MKFKQVNINAVEKYLDDILDKCKRQINKKKQYNIPDCRWKRYCKSGAKIKIDRLEGDLETGNIKEDTLIDLINYIVLYMKG